MKQLRRSLPFFLPDAWRVAGALGLLVLSAVAGALKPWPIALAIDSILGGAPWPAWLVATGVPLDRPVLLAAAAAAVFALYAGQAALAAWQNYMAIGVGLEGLRRVRHTVFNRLLKLSLRFHQGAQSGDMIYRATWDPYAFQTLFQQGFMTFCASLLSLGMMTVVMLHLNGRLTVVALAVAPLLVLSIDRFGRRMRGRAAEAQEADSQVAASVQQCLAALPIIQGNAQEAREAGRFAARSGAARASRLRQHGSELLYGLAVSVIFALGTAAVVWMGSREVAAGRLSIGGLVVFLAYLTQFYDPLSQLTHAGSSVAHSGAGAQRVFALLDTPLEVQEAPQPVPLSLVRPPDAAPGQDVDQPHQVAGALGLERVCFGYEPKRLVLDDLSLQIRAGERVAILGPSGSGKTTLLQLLPRFFDPQRGRVTLDGLDLKALRLADLRQMVAHVTQETILLPGTVAENIGCGLPQATPERIEAAARAAHADSFITRLPRGYDTPIGEGAARLSVGEKQRLNLARAFLKDAPILLLDEPTSALDAESEALVLASLARLAQGRTTLMVTHRWHALGLVNRILVLRQGRVAEEGSLAELLANPASYLARLAANRAGGTGADRSSTPSAGR